MLSSRSSLRWAPEGLSPSSPTFAVGSRAAFSRGFAAASFPSDPYELLGVQRGASEDELKKAYRTQALKVPPFPQPAHPRPTPRARRRATAWRARFTSGSVTLPRGAHFLPPLISLRPAALTRSGTRTATRRRPSPRPRSASRPSPKRTRRSPARPAAPRTTPARRTEAQGPARAPGRAARASGGTRATGTKGRSPAAAGSGRSGATPVSSHHLLRAALTQLYPRCRLRADPDARRRPAARRAHVARGGGPDVPGDVRRHGRRLRGAPGPPQRARRRRVRPLHRARLCCFRAGSRAGDTGGGARDGRGRGEGDARGGDGHGRGRREGGARAAAWPHSNPLSRALLLCVLYIFRAEARAPALCRPQEVVQEVITRAGGLRVLRTTRTTIAPNSARIVTVNERILGQGEATGAGFRSGFEGQQQQRRAAAALELRSVLAPGMRLAATAADCGPGLPSRRAGRRRGRSLRSRGGRSSATSSGASSRARRLCSCRW